jgi:type I restriction enzyme M protein
MLDDVTKKRINTLRQILVGKLPDPKAQVEQITNALIYKFMNDMDQQSVSLGGKATYFAGKFQKYSWKNLLDTKTSGVEKTILYSEALNGMSNNENLPELFREIFKDSVLPFKDPSTLNKFLKEINEFHYSNSEKLGDAFEYLLSFMGSQGDAGQFRTPRHIIDFIVEIINPQKNETILDPACGTAGFLISSYKQILKQNTKKNLGDCLNVSDRKKIGENLNGYDISPDMVKMSLVNMYLHKFTNPKIDEYDTLSSEDKWNEYYDVILANPPFFSPSGGIVPHNRFTINSTRAEVLFIDYINEHLKPNGRAGIIVPEGIIYNIGNTFKNLRKKLVDESLIGVISLPAGVFNPYANVKTSILILDKNKSKKDSSIFFATINNDGFELGAQRNPINKNDIPLLMQDIYNYKNGKNDYKILKIINKDRIKNNNYTLLSRNYQNNDFNYNDNKNLIKLGDISEIVTKGTTPTTMGFKFEENGINFIKIENINLDGNIRFNKLKKISRDCHSSLKRSQLKENDILFSIAGSLGTICIVPKELLPCNTNQALAIIRLKKDIDHNFVLKILRSSNILKQIQAKKVGFAQFNLSLVDIKELVIPFPNKENQKSILNKIYKFENLILESEKNISVNKNEIENLINEFWIK